MPGVVIEAVTAAAAAAHSDPREFLRSLALWKMLPKKEDWCWRPRALPALVAEIPAAAPAAAEAAAAAVVEAWCCRFLGDESRLIVLLVVDDWNEMDIPESSDPTLPRR